MVVFGDIMNCIRTVDDLVEALGGDTAVAHWLRITQGAVANWKQRGEIPGGWHLRLYARLLAEGWEVDTAAVFGLSDRESRMLRRVHKPHPERMRVAHL